MVWELPEGFGGPDRQEQKLKNWDNFNSTINNIIMLKGNIINVSLSINKYLY